MCPAVATDEPNRCSWAASVPVEELSKAIAAAVGVWQPPAAPPLARLKSLQTPAAVRPCPARVSCNVTVQQMPVRRPTMIEVQEVQTQQQQQQQQLQHVVAPVSPCVQQPNKKQQQQNKLVLFDNMDDMAAGIHVLGDVQEWQQGLIPCGSPSQHSPTSSSSSSSIASGPQLWVRSSVQQPHSSQHAANSTGLELDSSSISSTGSISSSCCSQTCLDQLWVSSSSSSSPRSSLDESSSLEHHQLCDSGLECEAGSACDELGADLCNAIGSLSPVSSVGSVSGTSSSSRAKQVKHVSWGPVSVVEFQVAPDASWLSSLMTRGVSAWWGSSSSSMPCRQVAAAGLMVAAAAMAAGALLARHAASRS